MRYAFTDTGFRFASVKASRVWPSTLTLDPAMAHVYSIPPSTSGAERYNAEYYVQSSLGGRVFPLRWQGTTHMSGALAAALQRAPHTIRASREQTQLAGPEFYDVVGPSSPASGAAESEGRSSSWSRPASRGSSRGASLADTARARRAATGLNPDSAASQQSLIRAEAPRNLSVSR